MPLRMHSILNIQMMNYFEVLGHSLEFYSFNLLGKRGISKHKDIYQSKRTVGHISMSSFWSRVSLLFNKTQNQTPIEISL